MDGKWVPGLLPDDTVQAAALRVLQSRLDAVRSWLPLVAHAEKDLEFVHQLRVSTRRAGAALRLFRGCLRRRDYRLIRDLLREIRQTAGEARDWDVFLESLREPPLSGSPAREFLLGLGVARRMAAQPALNRMALERRQPLDRVAEGLPELLQPAGPQLPGCFGELLLSETRVLLNQLHDRTHPLPDDYAALHQVRILGKKLRYVLELGVDCFTAEARSQVLPQVEAMQKLLGNANDAFVALQRLREVEQFLKQFVPSEVEAHRVALLALQRHHAERMERQGSQFAQWLQAWETATPEPKLRPPTRTHARPNVQPSVESPGFPT